MALLRSWTGDHRRPGSPPLPGGRRSVDEREIVTAHLREQQRRIRVLRERVTAQTASDHQ